MLTSSKCLCWRDVDVVNVNVVNDIVVNNDVVNVDIVNVDAVNVDANVNVMSMSFMSTRYVDIHAMSMSTSSMPCQCPHHRHHVHVDVISAMSTSTTYPRRCNWRNVYVYVIDAMSMFMTISLTICQQSISFSHPQATKNLQKLPHYLGFPSSLAKPRVTPSQSVLQFKCTKHKLLVGVTYRFLTGFCTFLLRQAYPVQGHYFWWCT